MQELPGYTIEKTLYSSESSVVYRARRDADGRSVVLKFPQARPASARLLTRYRNEFEILQSLESEHVSKALDFVRHAGSVALVLDAFDGVPINDWAQSRKPDIAERLKAALQITAAVCDTHSFGIIHKDINPSNLLIEADSMQVKLIDFGISSRLRSEKGGFGATTALEGTLAYIAPEQTGRMNHSIDQRADLYSLGMTLYELFCGRLPHSNDEALEVVHFHIAGTPLPLAEMNPDVPQAISDIVAKLLQKSPEDRYQSAEGLRIDLRRCSDELSKSGHIEPFELGLSDRVNRFHLPERLYGRDDDVRRLVQAFERTAGGTVESVLIAGNPGIGKTSLVREIFTPVTRRRGYFCTGKFDQLRQSSPFSALVEALQGLVSQLLTESEERLERWRAEIGEALGSNGQIIVDVIPSLELIIGPQPAIPELSGAEARNRFEHYFRRFVQVFTRRDHPLVIFLDDVQWADSASLTLSNILLSAAETEALLLVQSYRDDEVTATHSLMNSVNSLKEQGVHVSQIELGPLQTRDIEELITDTLHCSTETTRQLAEVVSQKTGGNAFFIGQFLTSLHEDGLLEYSVADQSFQLDIDAINNAAITDNVAELLTRKLAELPESTLESLRIAAAIGRRFEIETISSLNGTSEADTAMRLKPAIAAEVIVPVSQLESLISPDSHASLGYRHLQFLHDRLQQATYDTIESDMRPRLHLDIGRAKLAELESAMDDQNLFEVVSHMNRGIQLIESPEERRHLATLNVRANAKAKKSTAYPLAIEFGEKALELLSDEVTGAEDADLVFAAHEELAEALTLNAQHERALEIIDLALTHAPTALQTATLFALKLSTFLGLGDMPAALKTGREALMHFGVALPDNQDEIESALQREINQILSRTEEIGFEKLLDLPRMTSAEEMKLMELMAHCMPAAYQTDKQLFSLICCRMVLLSLDSGHCPLSSRAYTSFGALLSGVLSDYSRAFKFTRLAIDLAVRLEDQTVLAGVYMVHGLFASHWNEPIDASIEAFQRSFEYGVQHGDHVHAAYAIARKICYQQFRGRQLEELREDAMAAVAHIERFGDKANVAFVEARILLIDRLIEGNFEAGLNTPQKSEAERLNEARERGNYSFLSDLLIVLVTQRVYAGAWDEALQYLRESENLIAYSAAFATQAEHSFFAILTAATLLSDEPSPDARTELEAMLDTNIGRLKTWSEQCPPNYEHMYLLALAEKARLDGNVLEAVQLYDAAIGAATDNGFVNIEALAAECAANFWASNEKPEFSRIYIDKALAALESWGAAARAEKLRTRHGLSGKNSRTVSVTTSSTAGGSKSQRDALDFATALKATQTLASEIRLDRLVASMIDIILENVGGERAVLVLGSSGDFFVQGLKTSFEDDTQVMLDEPLATTDSLSRGIANYVLRTGEHVVLENPATKGTFRNDDYISARQPKSVLCAPIIYKGEQRGLVYLENNQVAGAFTPDRLETLKLLMSQIGVSVENAMLYASQENQARRIEKANADLAVEIGERKAAEAELSKYKDQLEELVRQRTRELESAQGRLVELSRRSGMAEVAAGVLHNVGNVMNSVNVGAHVARDTLRELKIEQIGKVCDQLENNSERLGEYLRDDPTGSKISAYLRKLQAVLKGKKDEVHAELDRLLDHLEHMKRVIAAQQTYAKTGGVEEICTLESILDTALAISEAGLRSSQVDVTADSGDLPAAPFDRHRILQILINLLSNARHAVEGNEIGDRRIDVSIGQRDDWFFVEVADNGTGIPAENLSRIFNHGFTTKRDGHGFGLHNCANAAQELDGSLEAFSDGPGQGAKFVLCLPWRASETLKSDAGAA